MGWPVAERLAGLRTFYTSPMWRETGQEVGTMLAARGRVRLLEPVSKTARFDPKQRLISLEEQNRAHWDHGLKDEGLALLDIAVGRRLPGPFQLQAAISALHIQAEKPGQTDWHQILLLYDRLLALAPSPIVALNRNVALAETGALRQARRDLSDLAEPLASYQPYHAATAELARRAGDTDAARTAYSTAIRLSQSSSERNWLKARLDTL